MAIDLLPIPLPDTADSGKFQNFGRKVRGVNPANLSPEDFEAIRVALYTHDALLFRNTKITPEEQYALTKAFDSQSENYGHGNKQTEADKKSILHPDLKTISRVPQVQVIGNGTIHDYEGLTEAHLKHPSHKTFHKTVMLPEDEEKGITRFYRWHIDAALYNLNPPRVTTLYGKMVPQGHHQTVRYNDGTGQELPVPLGTTAFVSGKTMFSILPNNLKSVAVRGRVKYAPHPYVWMSPAHARSTGLGIECEGLEVPVQQLPPWEESKIKTFPMLWKNPITDELSFQVHPCGAQEILIEPLPAGADVKDALYPHGGHLTDLKEVRELLYKMQQPGINPEFVYPHDWQEDDLVLFHNRGILHSVVGAFSPDQVRVFHQCNLAASDEPAGPTAVDVSRYA